MGIHASVGYMLVAIDLVNQHFVTPRGCLSDREGLGQKRGQGGTRRTALRHPLDFSSRVKIMKTLYEPK